MTPGAAARRRRGRRRRGAAGAGRGRHRDRLRQPAGGRAGLAATAAPSGSTWSTWTPRSGGAATATCWPRWSAGWTSQVELSGGIRDDDSLAAALATGCARVNLGTAALESPDWVRSAIARLRRPDRGRPGRPRHHAGRPRLDLRRRRPVRDAGPARRRRLRPLRGDRRAPRRHPDRAEPDLLRDVCAATDRPVVASGGVSSLDDLRVLAGLTGLGVEGAIVGKALYAGAFTLARGAGSRSAAGLSGDGLAVRVIPVPGRRRRPGGQGRQLHRPARCRRPGGAGPPLRRRGRRRADLPRHHRLLGRPARPPTRWSGGPPSRCSSR